MTETDAKSEVEQPAPDAAEEADGKKEKKTSSPREFLTTIVIAVLIAITFRTFAYEPFNIPSGSMYPNLLVGDYLLVSKFSYGYSKHSFPWSLGPFDGRIFESQVERGDIAVFKEPIDNDQDYIKRIIGLPGDTIAVSNGRLIINGEPVKRERIEDFVHPDTGWSYNQYVDTLPNGVSYRNLECSYYEEPRRSGQYRKTCATARLDTFGPVTVGAGEYFAMGDNRQNSSDGRVFGMLPAENLVGRADIIFFSACGEPCDASLFEPWTWFRAMRYDRFFKVIE